MPFGAIAGLGTSFVGGLFGRKKAKKAARETMVIDSAVPQFQNEVDATLEQVRRGEITAAKGMEQVSEAWRVLHEQVLPITKGNPWPGQPANCTSPLPARNCNAGCNVQHATFRIRCQAMERLQLAEKQAVKSGARAQAARLNAGPQGVASGETPKGFVPKATEAVKKFVRTPVGVGTMILVPGSLILLAVFLFRRRKAS